MMKDNLTEADLRQMIENRDYLIAEYQKQIEALKDPVVVHIGMLRGGIAMPSWAQIVHLYQPQLKANGVSAEAIGEIELLKRQVQDAEIALGTWDPNRNSKYWLRHEQVREDTP